jgi:hypothetical protein
MNPQYVFGLPTYGGTKTMWHLTTFCVAITAYAFNLEYWVCFVIPTQSIVDCESMGIEGWSNGYKR